MKKIFSKKEEVGNRKIIKLSVRCNALIQQEMPPKQGDPRDFSVPFEIGGMKFEKALSDLGASVSTLPYSKCKELSLGELMHFDFALQLADWSVKKVLGILEDVPVKVGDIYIPIDFMVMDTNENPNVTIIPGRPFMATTGTIIC